MYLILQIVNKIPTSISFLPLKCDFGVVAEIYSETGNPCGKILMQCLSNLANVNNGLIHVGIEIVQFC